MIPNTLYWGGGNCTYFYHFIIALVPVYVFYYLVCYN